MIESLEARTLFATTGLDPSYGSDGQAEIAVAANSHVAASVFTPSGAAYILVNEGTGKSENRTPLTRSSVIRLTPSGTLDPTFGINGRAIVSQAYAGNFISTLAVSPAGRVFAIDVGPGTQMLSATGRPLPGASKRLRSIQNGLQPTDIHAAAFDSDGRLYLAGGFHTLGKQSYVYGVTRYTSDGRLDTAWAQSGFASGAFNPENPIYEDLNNSASKIAITPDGHLTATFNYSSYFDPYGDGSGSRSDATIDALTLAPNGTRVGINTIADAENAYGGLVFVDAFDLRALPDNTFVAATQGHQYEASPLRINIATNGTASESAITGGFAMDPLRLLPSGRLIADPSLSDSQYSAYFPAAGRADGTSFFGSYVDLAALGDGRLMDSAVVGDGVDDKLIVRRFDGTGRYVPAASGVAALRTATRTLDVAGTSGNDTIWVRRRGDRLAVRINGGSVLGFNAADVDTILIHGDAGDDAIDLRLAGLAMAVRISGGAGSDTLLADHPDATLDGGADDDFLRGPGYLDGGDGDDQLNGIGLLRGGAGDDVLLGHRRGEAVPTADD